MRMTPNLERTVRIRPPPMCWKAAFYAAVTHITTSCLSHWLVRYRTRLPSVETLANRYLRLLEPNPALLASRLLLRRGVF